MDEDEEIDIIGNYENFISKSDQDISKISSGQILSCDYTVHPNWLNENPEAGSYWTDSVPKSENLESNVEILHSEEVVIEEPEPVPNIADNEWTGELGSHDDLVFEDDIPASIEEIVSNQDGDDASKASTNSSEWDHFELETAAYETHPPPQNIKLIGPTHSRSLLKVKMESPCNERSEVRPPSKFKQTLSVNSHLLKLMHKSQATRRLNISRPINTSNVMQTEKKAKVKFKETVKMVNRDLPGLKLAVPVRKPKKHSGNESKGKRKPRKQKKARNFADENITISHEMESFTARRPMAAEVCVKIQKCESESDVEIDIESDDPIESKQTMNEAKPTEITPNSISRSIEFQLDSRENKMRENYENFHIPLEERFPNLSPELIVELKDKNVPIEELRIKSIEVSNLEKFFHSDFFENRTTKTPEQYLRIRNHIVNLWQINKPNYISKTAVRNGLKHGGDVNCISRIHRLLEQMGAINFGLAETYFNYVRPFEAFISMFMQMPRNRTNSSSFSALQQRKERRARIRTNTFTPVIVDDDTADINYTIVHMDGVMLPNPLPRPKDAVKPRSTTRHIKSEFDLIKCLKFSGESSAPFTISITLSTLLCLRLHAISSNFEVMGFLGGYQHEIMGKLGVHLTRYKPCRTSAQSGTACEMCPVSQVEQSANLSSEGYELLGWFHSHPLFPANPSRTDIRTQKEMQLQFSFDNNRPFVGIILSCVNMSLKCIYMMPANSIDGDYADNNMPYEIDVDVTKDCASFKVDIEEVLFILRNDVEDLRNVYNKFKSTSETLCQQLGYDCESLFQDVLQ